MPGYPGYTVRETAFSVTPARKGFFLRDDQLAYMQYGENANPGVELLDMKKDPGHFTDLASNPRFTGMVAAYLQNLATKLQQLRYNDLGHPASK